MYALNWITCPRNYAAVKVVIYWCTAAMNMPAYGIVALWNKTGCLNVYFVIMLFKTSYVKFTDDKSYSNKLILFYKSWMFMITVNRKYGLEMCFHPAALKGSGVLSYPERAGGRAARQTNPVNTLTSIIFHGSFSYLARTFITLRSRTSSIMEVLPH